MIINKGFIGVNHSVGSDIWTKATPFVLLIWQCHRIEVISGDPAQQMISIKIHCWRSRLVSKVLRVFNEVFQRYENDIEGFQVSVFGWKLTTPPLRPPMVSRNMNSPYTFWPMFHSSAVHYLMFPVCLGHLNYLVCMCVVYLFYSNIWYQDRVHFGALDAATH